MTRLLLLFALACPLVAQAQADRPLLVYEPDPPAEMTDEEAVRAAVVALFDGMRASDSEAVGAVFHPNATLQSVSSTGAGTYQIQGGDIAGFVASIGGAPKGALDETIGEIAVEIDAGLAHAWMDYEFHYQGQFSHCGVNSMQFVKTDAGWQILNVVDTRRRDCESEE